MNVQRKHAAETEAQPPAGVGRVRRVVGVSVLAVLAACVLAGGSYYVWLTTPPPLPRTAVEAGKLLTSPRYQRLPEHRRLEYMPRIVELYDHASPEEQKQLRALRHDTANREAVKQAVRDRIVMEMAKYAKADDFERRRMVDQVIAMQEMMVAHERSKGSREDTPERQARRARRQSEMIREIQGQIEHGNPQHQAYVGEFFKALMARRRQMGLDSLPVELNR